MISPSTKKFWRVARKEKNWSLGKWIHGYIYGRWIYFYISLGTGRHPLARALSPLIHLFEKIFAPQKDGKRLGSSFAESYHGKVLRIEEANQMVTVNRKIEIRDLEKIIPYTLARDIVLENPEKILTLECPCRASMENPCLPLDVCLVMGEPFVSFILEHHPKRTKEISQEEALVIIKRAHDRGEVHHAFFKEEMLGRFYAICNCCSCCCGAIAAMKKGTPMLAPSGYRIRKSESCINCGKCVKTCPFDALQLVGEKLQITDSCMGCGACVSSCSKYALSLERDASNGVPLELKSLMSETVNRQDSVGV
ncbi:MAG: 4Fe-4S binding protein [Desulfotalea sp.]